LISDGNGLSHRVRADSNTIRNRALLHSEAAERSFEGEVRTGSGSEGGARDESTDTRPGRSRSRF
jgi:hypothetical protein